MRIFISTCYPKNLIGYIYVRPSLYVALQTNSIQTNFMATLLRRFIRVGQTDKTSDTNLILTILQTITVRFRRHSRDAFQTNLIA